MVQELRLERGYILGLRANRTKEPCGYSEYRAVVVASCV
jgi:hypothetical protein